MKTFELTISHRSGDFKPISVNKIESDDLVHLLCQFNLIIVGILREMHEMDPLREISNMDDVPF